jgi:fatty-acyl-CoA synthase
MSAHENKRLFDCFDVTAREFASRAAVKAGDTSWTYGELHALAKRYGRALIAAGVARGDRVGTLMNNCPEWAALWWAGAEVGAAVVPINLRLTPREIGEICKDARLSLVICDQGREIEQSEGGAAHESIVVLNEESGQRFLAGAEGVSEAVAAGRREGVTAEDPVLIVYTSGTTGRPKGVVLTHRNVVSNIERQNEHFEAGPEEVLVTALPFAHVGGATETVAASMMGGGKLVLMNKFDPGEWLALIESEKATFAGGVPTMFAMLLQHPKVRETDLSTVRRVVYAGAPCSPALFEAIRKLEVTIQTGYGMTEAAGFVTYTDPDDPPEAIRDTVGRIADGFELRIVDGDHQPLPNGEVGEVALRGDCVTPGYLFNDEATREVIDEERWYYSGDMGYLDEAGRLRLAGRKKEMYITGGYNVYPAEVEAHLERHAGVAMAACMAVADETMSEVGWAFVMCPGEAPPTAEQLKAHCRDGLARYKVPAKFIVKPMLPMTPLGKIDKQALKREIASG